MNSCGCFVMSLFVGLYTHQVGEGGGAEKKKAQVSGTEVSGSHPLCGACGGRGRGSHMPCVRVVFADLHVVFFLFIFFPPPLHLFLMAFT